MSQQETQFKRKLYGWISYAFASEVFVIVSLTLFLPVCLEQFARDNGFLVPDMTQPCYSMEGPRCVVKIGWSWIDTASFSLYVNSASVALQALTVISMGGIADHPPHRKKLLLMFAAIGSTSAILFLLLPSKSSLWFLCAPLAIFANVGFGASIVAMNAYLPSLAKESPEVVALQRDSFDSESDSAPLLESSDHQVNNKPYDDALSAAMSRISSLGIALGYAAGILLLLLTLIPAVTLEGSTFSLRLAIGLSGIWWALFSIPAALWLPGESTEKYEEEHPEKWVMSKEIIAAWVRLGGMLKWREIKNLRNTFKYLAAWFFLSDGFTTITSTAILFAKTELGMPPASLIVIGILSPVSGIAGSLIWPRLQRRYKWSNLRILVTLVIMASLIPAYGCLGFLTTKKDDYGVFTQRVKLSFGGLTTPGEMFVLAVYFGSVYGAFQAYARAFYAELLPPGEEARWYGLFSITDKSSSFVGPLVVGLISDASGNIRYAFFFLVGMIWFAIPILASVNVERGKKDAKAYKYGQRA